MPRAALQISKKTAYRCKYTFIFSVLHILSCGFTIQYFGRIFCFKNYAQNCGYNWSFSPCQ